MGSNAQDESDWFFVEFCGDIAVKKELNEAKMNISRALNPKTCLLAFIYAIFTQVSRFQLPWPSGLGRLAYTEKIASSILAGSTYLHFFHYF